MGFEIFWHLLPLLLRQQLEIQVIPDTFQECVPVIPWLYEYNIDTFVALNEIPVDRNPRQWESDRSEHSSRSGTRSSKLARIFTRLFISDLDTEAIHTNLTETCSQDRKNFNQLDHVLCATP